MSDSEYVRPSGSPTIKPIGVIGAEYRRQWNRLNRERCKESTRRFRTNHPEKQRKIPAYVVQRYRKKRRLNKQFRILIKQHYYRGWDKAKRRCQLWDCIDDELVMHFDGTDRTLSEMIGRSINAIQKRRYQLLRSNAAADLQKPGEA